MNRNYHVDRLRRDEAKYLTISQTVGSGRVGRIVISCGMCLEPTTTDDGSGDDDDNEVVDAETDYDRYDGDDNKPTRPVGKTSDDEAL